MPCSKGMRGCVASCGHRRFVREYQTERYRQEMVREDATGGYETELAQYNSERRLITFQQWLIDHAGMSEADATFNTDPHDQEMIA